MSTSTKFAIEPALIDQLVGGQNARTLFEPNGVFDKLRLALFERLNQSEGDDSTFALDLLRVRSDMIPLGEGPADVTIHQTTRTKKGGRKTRSAAELEMLLANLLERIVALYLRGYRSDEIAKRLSMLTGEHVPTKFVAERIVDLREEAQEWQSRTLYPSYPIVTFERIQVKWRDATGVKPRSCHFAIGFQPGGTKELLGIWLNDESEGQVWSGIVADLRARGVEDVLYIVANGCNSLQPHAAAFHPAAIVANPGELIRQSLAIASTKDRSVIQQALRNAHNASCEAEALENLNIFGRGPLGTKYPAIVSIWRRHWSDLSPFFLVPAEVRRVMTSIHASEEIRRDFHRTLRSHAHMSCSQNTCALMYSSVKHTLRGWRRPQREWHAAKSRLAIEFPDRFTP